MFRKTLITLFMVINLVTQPLSAWAQTPAEMAADPLQSQVAPAPGDSSSEATPEGNPSSQAPPPTHTIYLKSRQFIPGTTDREVLSRLENTGKGRAHILVQLDFIPRERAKAALEASGLKLLVYVPDYAWIASVPTTDAASVLNLSGVTWAGELRVNDKLDPAVRADSWGPYNLAPGGSTVAIYVIIHKDESLDTGRELVARYSGTVTGTAQGINLLIVEIPKDNLRALAAEDAVQWIESAAPPLSGTNDGLRAQIGVDEVNAAPYNLDGSGVDVLVYDAGQVAPHVDFDTRLTIGAGDSTSINYHATHVAGIVGGSGSNSASESGTDLQWRGMAPAVDLISYGLGWDGSGVPFYTNPGDIEADFAAAQNTYGADIANVSLGTNIYLNDWGPDKCDMMGKYGAASVLIDQIIRGGNSEVGIGDKYINSWAAGNERGWGTSSCATYSIVAPPSGAKNPIQVGGSNTNDNTQYAHTSWGPTEDGRIKPIVTAGGCQTSDDNGITSTDDDPLHAYQARCGTSMAAPAVAGGIALMLQHYRDVYNTSGNFWPSTAKAILMQTADDFGNPGPDYQWGFGQVDIQASVDLITRRAFRQESINSGEVDSFSVTIPDNSNPLRVSLAWDDIEATPNANPTLINNLDIDLIDPDGTPWYPWVLDPDNPGNNATRGVDSRNNQEQVEVPNPDIGTWTVIVRATSIPDGPQDYSLACEGCKPLDLGVCADVVVGTSSAVANLTEAIKTNGLTEHSQDVEPVELRPALTEGERWQRALEAVVSNGVTSLQDDLQAIQDARESGPEALVALLDTLTGPSRDMVMDEIQDAHKQLIENAPAPQERTPLTEAEEAALNQAQEAIIAENRAVTILFNDPNEGSGEGQVVTYDKHTIAPADHTVGAGKCDFPTISAAIAASDPDDRLLIEGGVTFTENIVIDKNLILQGGYAGCASGSSDLSTIDGSASGSVVIINPGLKVGLGNLKITNGYIAGKGGGIRFADGGSVGNLNLENVQIYSNTAQWGGGIWVGVNALVSAESVSIYLNTANTYGGGVRLLGGRAEFQNSDIFSNNAPMGGGVYGTPQDTHTPEINLPISSAIFSNNATTGEGLGGGVFLQEGNLTLGNFSDIYLNEAIEGGGVYILTSTLTIVGNSSEIDSNAAMGNGGGIYAKSSVVNLENRAELFRNDAGTGGTGSGGGAYLDQSDLISQKAGIRANSAADHGGGVAAVNGSSVLMELGPYLCSSTHCSELSGNEATNNFGGGIYANDSVVYLNNTFVENNTANYGGGVYATQSAIQANSSVFARNDSLGGTGDAIRLYSSSSMAGSGNTVAYNNTGGASDGRAIELNSSSLTLGCSIIWGHALSITPAGQDVTYSDIQYGYGDASNIDTDPLFVSAASQDYHLHGSSPLIDRCISGPSTDFENQNRPIVRNTGASPYDMGADEVAGIERVGLNGSCAYSTIQQAVNAASDGDTVRISVGLYFENVDVSDKTLTIEGNYDGNCVGKVGGPTRVEGSLQTGSTFDISNSRITLRDLEAAWGSDHGAGVDALSNSHVFLNNVDIVNNHGFQGGGIYLGPSSVMTATNGTSILENTATVFGGGTRIIGQFSGLDNTVIMGNCAPDGGGFYVTEGELNLNYAVVLLNQAAGQNGNGGGIYAKDGAIIRLSDSTGIGGNFAEVSGGGIYLEGASMLDASETSIGFRFLNASLGNQANYGAGISTINSTVDFSGTIDLNIADTGGAGLYANNSTVTLRDTIVGGNTESYQGNQLGPDGNLGVGMYLDNGTETVLDNTAVVSNTFQTTGSTYGGGIYVNGGSTLTMTNDSRIEDHLAPSTSGGRGAGIYVNDSTVTIDNSQVVSNTAYTNGGGIRLNNSSTLNILNGAILSNNSSINGEGGGIAATGNPDINVIEGTFHHNYAGTDGGAIYMDSGTLNLDGTWDLRWNHADENGGAVAVQGTGDAEFKASTGTSYLAVNTSNLNGGGIQIANDGVVALHAVSGFQLRLNTNNAGVHGGAGYADNSGFFDVYGDVQAGSNHAGELGGVFYLSGGSSLWLDDHYSGFPTLFGNDADSGGAIYAIDSPRVDCDGAQFGSIEIGNQATDGVGGAISLDNSDFTANNCIFHNNQATGSGGAIAAANGSELIIGTDYPAPLMANALWIGDRNTLAPGSPTAIICDPTTECSSFRYNTADTDLNDIGSGGAIYTENSSLELSNSYLHHNSAYLGGAIYQTGMISSGAISNSLIHKNSVSGPTGAGVSAYQGNLSLNHITLADNSGAPGFSGDPDATIQVYNSIAWGNYLIGFIGIFTDSSCNIDQSGNIGTNSDPLFVDSVSDNYHLMVGSPAINACASGLTTDLDNYSRPFGGFYDMGAYEFSTAYNFLPMILR